MAFICGIISLIITLTNVLKMIIESIPTTLRSAISAGIGGFPAPMLGLRMLVSLEIPQSIQVTYTAVGEERTRLKLHLQANSSSCSRLGRLQYSSRIVALAVWHYYHLLFVVKGIQGGIYSFYFNNDRPYIAVGVVKLSGIDFC